MRPEWSLGWPTRLRLALGLPLLVLAMPLLVLLVAGLSALVSVWWLLLAVLTARLSFPLSARCLAACSCNLGLVKASLKTFGLGVGPPGGIVLRQPEAPRLFEVMKEVAEQLGVACPREVRLELGCNASIGSHGMLRAVSNYVLTLGFACFAVLSEDEMRCLLIHELGHLGRRFRGVALPLVRSLGMLHFLAFTVHAYTRDVEQERPFWTGRLLCAVIDLVGEPSAALGAAWSRQHEFEALVLEVREVGKEVAAQVSAKMAVWSQIADQIPLRDLRCAAAVGADFLETWQRYLWPEDLDSEAAIDLFLRQEKPSEYGSHPLLRDELEYLGIEGNPQLTKASCFEWLASPEETAQKLLERADSDSLRVEQQRLTYFEEQIRRMMGELFRPVRWLDFVLPTLAVVGGALWFVFSFLERTGQLQLPIILVLLGAAGLWTLWPKARRLRTKDDHLLQPPYYDSLADARHRRLFGEGPPAFDPACSDPLESLRRCRYEQALEEAERILEKDPKNLFARLIAAVAYAGVGKESSSYKAVASLVREHGNSYAVDLAITWAAFALGRYPLTIVMARELQKRFGPDPILTLMAGMAMVNENLMQQSLRVWEDIVRMCPENQRARYHLAALYREIGKLQQAVRCLDPVLATEKGNHETWRSSAYSLGIRCKLALNDREGAERLAATLRDLVAPDEYAWHVGFAYLQEKMLEEAYPLLLEAYEAKRHPMLAVGLAVAARWLGYEERVRELASWALRIVAAEHSRYEAPHELLAWAATLVACPTKPIRRIDLLWYDVYLRLDGSVIPSLSGIAMRLAASGEQQAHTMARTIAATFGIPSDRLQEQIEGVHEVGPVMSMNEPRVASVSLAPNEAQ